MIGLAIGRPGSLSFALSDIPTSGATIEDTGAATTTYSVQIYFRTDGTVDVVRNITGTSNDIETFCIPPGAVTSIPMYVRCTEGTGGVALNLGDTTGVWHSLAAADKSFGLTYTSTGGVDFITSHTLTFELSPNNGSDVVATRSGVVITVGETS